MAYETINTFTEVVSDADNLNRLIKNINGTAVPNSYFYKSTVDKSTTSGSWVEIDPTNLSRTIETLGGDLFILFNARLYNATAGNQVIKVVVDGVDRAISGYTSGVNYNLTTVAFTVTVTGLSAGEHTVQMYWATAGGTLLLDAPTILFFVREL